MIDAVAVGVVLGFVWHDLTCALGVMGDGQCVMGDVCEL